MSNTIEKHPGKFKPKEQPPTLQYWHAPMDFYSDYLPSPIQQNKPTQPTKPIKEPKNLKPPQPFADLLEGFEIDEAVIEEIPLDKIASKRVPMSQEVVSHAFGDLTKELELDDVIEEIPLDSQPTIVARPVDDMSTTFSKYQKVEKMLVTATESVAAVSAIYCCPPKVGSDGSIFHSSKQALNSNDLNKLLENNKTIQPMDKNPVEQEKPKQNYENELSVNNKPKLEKEELEVFPGCLPGRYHVKGILGPDGRPKELTLKELQEIVAAAKSVETLDDTEELAEQGKEEQLKILKSLGSPDPKNRNTTYILNQMRSMGIKITSHPELGCCAPNILGSGGSSVPRFTGGSANSNEKHSGHSHCKGCGEDVEENKTLCSSCESKVAVEAINN